MFDNVFSTVAAPMEMTKDRMQYYLQHMKRLDKEVIIRHAKVAQKSYKNEKRLGFYKGYNLVNINTYYYHFTINTKRTKTYPGTIFNIVSQIRK